MATALDIELASRTRKPSKSIDTLDVGKVDLFPDATPEEYSEAREFVKRLANRHHCAGLDCTDPRHDDDVNACNRVLELLGLTVEEEAEEPETVPPVVVLTAATRRESRPLPCPSWGWQNDAACRGESLTLFFGIDGERGPEREIREQKAKAICSKCPVRKECGDYAISRPEKYGYWSMSEDERQVERRRRQRRAAA